jgi:hypothetical protein
MSSIDRACTDDAISRQACLEAWLRIQQQIKPLALEYVKQRALVAAWNEHDEL